MVPAVRCDVQVGLVDTGALETGIVFCYNLTNLGCLGSILLEVGGHENKIGTQLLGNEAGHAGAATVLPGDVVACCQDSFSDGKGQVFELGALKLFDSGIEGIAIEVDNVLGKVARQLEVGDKGVGFAEVTGQVEVVQGALLVEDAVDLDSEDLVALLFAVEVF